LRSLLVFPLFIVLTILFSLIAILVALVDSSGNRSHQAASLWATLILILSGVRVRVTNLNLLTPGRPYILAANHRSAFDIFALLSKIKIQFRWLAKESLFKVPVFGWAMKRAGYIPIDRSNAKKAYQSLIQAAEKIKAGTSILIFPEGTRQDAVTLGEFKSGGFHLALKSRQPIVPVSIRGSGQILPKNGFWIQPGTIRITVGDPIPTEGYTSKNMNELMEKVREGIVRNL
jgi:1-acyl-sn-glycerol-3-phosphate acyltransferase